MPEADDRSPVDQLVDLFVYAPVGLLLEYQDVLPKLIKRGKSQVQIAKLMGNMAAKQGKRSVNSKLGDAVGVASSAVAQGITEVGEKVGLAPDGASKPKDSPSADIVEPERVAPLPIAGYDDLKAKEIIALVGDLTPTQRERLRVHEAAGRARKTVLAKIDALAENA